MLCRMLSVFLTSVFLLCNKFIHVRNHPLSLQGEDIVPLDSVGNTDAVSVKKYVCDHKLSGPILGFHVNVTLNKTAILTDVSLGVLESSADDNTWHCVWDWNSHAAGELQVMFFLVYDGETPSGNCSFDFVTNQGFQELSQSVYSTELDPSFYVQTVYSTIAQTKNTPSLTSVTMERTTDPVTIESTEYKSYNSSCLCPCACVDPIPQQQAQEMLSQIVQNLSISKSNTSCSKRRLVSASDSRVSSKSLGLVGSFVLAVVFGLIFVGDAKLFLLNLKAGLTNVRSHFWY